MERLTMPRSQRIYGEFIYWITIASAIICTIGPVIAMVSVENNVMNPHYVYAGIFEGKGAEEIWQEVGGGFPGGHFYLRNFTFGDGFTQFGMALGCGVALPGLLAAAIAYFSDRTYGYAALCVWVASMITFSLLGVVGGH